VANLLVLSIVSRLEKFSSVFSVPWW